MADATKIQSMMICVIFVQYMKHRMQITQVWEYDLTINSLKFMQQMTLSLSEGDSRAYN